MASAGERTPRRRSSTPAIAFAALQPTLTCGDDIPTPGGSPNGLGNGRPCTPLTPCGTALTINAAPSALRTAVKIDTRPHYRECGRIIRSSEDARK